MHLRAYTAFCLYAGLLGMIRFFITSDSSLGGLIWNLILAVIPYFFALLAVEARGWKHGVFFSLWLLFFPNALYIFTDYIHLGRDPDIIHYDIVYIGVIALAGLIAGFASLELIHAYWNRRYHHVKSWIFISLIMVLSLFGVYLGRFLRFNSWDILHEPGNLLREICSLIISPDTIPSISTQSRALEGVLYGAHPINMYGFIALYFGFYMLLYIFLYHTKRVR